MESKSKKLTSKDVITVGAMGAIFVVVHLIFMIAGGFAPVFWLSTHLWVNIILGPVYVLLVAKTQKKGAVLIVSVLLGLVFTVSSWMVPVTSVIGGILAELILAKSQYKEKKSIVLSYIVFAFGFIGDFLPIWVTKTSYLQSMLDGGMDVSYVQQLERLISGPVIALVLLSILIGALVGALLGNKLMKKHFIKAGIA